MTDLLKKRQETIDLNKVAESTRNSGWHPRDDGGERREREKQLPLSERPVAIQDNRKVYFVADCVAKVKKALQGYMHTHKDDKEVSAYEQCVMDAAKDACEQGDKITLSTQDFNYANHALAQSGVQVVLVSA